MYLRLILLTLLSALLFPLALPNELFLDGNPLVGLFCLSFFFWALYESPSFRSASLLGAVFGMVSTILANFWLKNFNEYAFYTLGGTTLGYIGLNALLAPLIKGIGELKPHLRPLFTAMVFCVYEYLKSTGFLAYPWGLIAYPVHNILPFIQFVDLTGIWGLSFLCSFFNSLLAEVYAKRFSQKKTPPYKCLRILSPLLKAQALFALALVLIAFTYGSLRLSLGFPADKSLRVLLVQQNIDPWDSGKALAGLSAARTETLKGLNTSKTRWGSLPDLIVWSETALRYAIDAKQEYPFKNNSFFYKYFPNLFSEFNTNTLTGAPVVAPLPGRYYNAAILINAKGQVTDFYAKQHPVPFVESIPFMEIEPLREYFTNVLGLSNFWLMGKEAKTLTLLLADGSSVKIGVPICFEDVFPDICRAFVLNGAELLINIANDSWSKTKSALTQHLAAARFRAIETRRVLIRGTNAGLTCVVEPSGAISSSIPLFEQNHLLAEVAVAGTRQTTLYTILGDYLPYLFIIYLLSLMLIHAYPSLFTHLALKVKKIFSKTDFSKKNP